MHISENVIFQKTNEIYTNDAHWYVTFVHDLKPFQGLVNKIKDDIESTSEILHTITYDYDKRELVQYFETFIHEVGHLSTVKTVHKTFWTFTNVVLILFFVTIGIIIVMYIIKLRLKTYHSFCLKRTVDEHETAVTVLKLPTKDVEEESVPHSSGGGSTTRKDQTFLGQTDAVLAWPKVGTEIK
ncbi:MAG: hypothetical protein JAY75_05540 [Candidatus Thiodiazotropha taylori]|nr:hypothetical protein [Candidatus Thiodiazotropha taylori]MCW4307670.1 hypothetical protein [Candidatus Thiodiazotropha endolucinida]MCG8048218.1 hypothetical protein [Candidatus Thiodiazotropha taylori]MCG8075688.1 hypothetical protein [Candidatus Thiodiazotropha taylori]MCW4337116.1 hypothetical protein [Candidatus Thiodiazotropha endolucinida]